MIFYLTSNTIPDISFAVHQCGRFSNNTKTSHKTTMKNICRYLPGTKYNSIVFNPSNKIEVDCYADADFEGLWRHKDPQDLMCARSTTGFVLTFANCPLLWVSKIQTDIALSTLHSGYVSLSHSVRSLLPLKSLIKKVIYNLGIDGES